MHFLCSTEKNFIYFVGSQSGITETVRITEVIFLAR